MNKILSYFLLAFSILLVSCSTDEQSNLSDETINECGTHNGNRLHIGPEGGCYYINGNGNKTYVDRSECHC